MGESACGSRGTQTVGDHGIAPQEWRRQFVEGPCSGSIRKTARNGEHERNVFFRR
jgi:hypothetical protein